MKKTSKADQQFERIAKTVADPRRFEILRMIADRPELPCGELRAKLPITAATLSHHIKELQECGLVDLRKEGKCVHMKLRRTAWKSYLERLHKL